MIAILESYRAGLLDRAHLWRNLVAGVVVGVVALPLAMAFAIASGARPEQGLYTAIIAGLCTTLFGGTRLQISGPTGAFIAVFAVITAQHGIAGIEEHSEAQLAADSGLGANFVLPKDTVVYSIDGPFFFGAAENLEKTLRRSQNRVRTLVIRMGHVPFVDTTGLSALDEIVADFQRVGTRVVLCEVRADVLEKLERARILTRVGASGVYRTLSEFVASGTN